MTTESNKQSSSHQNPSSSEGTRKLAAIMFTDMKGYSAKMGKDETATMRMLKTHNQMVQEVVAKHIGSVIKTVGDAFLVSFESVVTAVQCAVDIQTGFHAYNRDKQLDEQIVIRIGVHVGDIIVKDNDVFGDGVNIAARIQPLASSGGICISEDVTHQLHGRLDLSLMRLGKAELKNIETPVVIYRVVLPWEKVTLSSVQRIRFALKRRHAKKALFLSTLALVMLVWFISQSPLFKSPYSASDLSIAVLPFVNVGDPTNDYLSDGITDDLISHLESDSALFVISKASSFFYKGKNIADSIVAQELRVRFLIKGSLEVTPTGTKLHSALFDTKINKEAWGENWDIARTEVYHTQELIPGKIAQALGLNAEAVKRHKREIPPEVYDTYLKGLSSVKKNENAVAIKYFKETLRIDSTFVSSLTALAIAQVVQYSQDGNLSPTLLSDAETNCRKALILEPQNAAAYAILGNIEMDRGNQTKTLELLNTALQLDPHEPLALTQLAELYLIRLNDVASGIKYLKTLQEVQPTSSENSSRLGIGYGQLKNYPEAIQAFRKAIQFKPDNADAWRNLGYSLERIGNYDSAVVSYKKAIETDPLVPSSYTYLVSILLLKKQYADAESVLNIGVKYLQGSYELMYAQGITYGIVGKLKESSRSYQDGLALLKRNLAKNPIVGDNHAFAGIFYARMDKKKDALREAETAMSIDSSNEEVIIKTARIYSLLKQKDKLLQFFERAKSMNPEYDAAYIATAMDFEAYRNDPDLLLIARQQ